MTTTRIRHMFATILHRYAQIRDAFAKVLDSSFADSRQIRASSRKFTQVRDAFAAHSRIRAHNSHKFAPVLDGYNIVPWRECASWSCHVTRSHQLSCCRWCADTSHLARRASRVGLLATMTRSGPIEPTVLDDSAAARAEWERARQQHNQHSQHSQQEDGVDQMMRFWEVNGILLLDPEGRGDCWGYAWMSAGDTIIDHVGKSIICAPYDDGRIKTIVMTKATNPSEHDLRAISRARDEVRHPSPGEARARAATHAALRVAPAMGQRVVCRRYAVRQPSHGQRARARGTANSLPYRVRPARVASPSRRSPRARVASCVADTHAHASRPLVVCACACVRRKVRKCYNGTSTQTTRVLGFSNDHDEHMRKDFEAYAAKLRGIGMQRWLQQPTRGRMSEFAGDAAFLILSVKHECTTLIIDAKTFRSGTPRATLIHGDALLENTAGTLAFCLNKLGDDMYQNRPLRVLLYYGPTFGGGDSSGHYRTLRPYEIDDAERRELVERLAAQHAERETRQEARRTDADAPRRELLGTPWPAWYGEEEEGTRSAPASVEPQYRWCATHAAGVGAYLHIECFGKFKRDPPGTRACKQCAMAGLHDNATAQRNEQPTFEQCVDLLSKLSRQRICIFEQKGRDGVAAAAMERIMAEDPRDRHLSQLTGAIRAVRTFEQHDLSENELSKGAARTLSD